MSFQSAVFTLFHHVLDTLLLLALPSRPLILFSELRQNVWLDGLEYSWEGGVLFVQQPSRFIGRVLEEDAAFKDGMFADTQIAAYWRHQVLSFFASSTMGR